MSEDNIIKTIVPKFVNTKQSTTANKRYLSIKAEDELYYAVWKPELFNYFSKGIPVEIEVEEIETAEGLKFNNVVGVTGRDVKKSFQKKDKGGITTKEKGAFNKNFCLSKSCDIIIALIQKGGKGGITKNKIVDEIKILYTKLLEILEK